jgi:hypothetical protein
MAAAVAQLADLLVADDNVIGFPMLITCSQ